MLKHAGKFNIGDTIRGYDFPGRTNTYVEGVVEDPNFSLHGVTYYKVKITSRPLDGKESHDEIGTHGYIPHEVSFFEYDGRVVKVEHRLGPCPKCSGKGWIRVSTKEFECDECEGWGETVHTTIIA